jgi:hypothetical protein
MVCASPLLTPVDRGVGGTKAEACWDCARTPSAAETNSSAPVMAPVHIKK